MLLQKIEQTAVLHNRHLGDLCQAVSHPPGVEGGEERPVCQSHHRRMVAAVDVLVSRPVAAGSGGRTGIDARDNRGSKHHIRCVPMIQCGSEPGNVCDHTPSHNEHGLISAHPGVLQIKEDILYAGDVLVLLHPTVDEFLQLNLMEAEVGVHGLPVDLVDLAVNDGNRTAEREVQLSELEVVEVKNAVDDLDGRGDLCAHHGLNERGVSGSVHNCVALSVDGGGVDGVGISGFKEGGVGLVGREGLSEGGGGLEETTGGGGEEGSADELFDHNLGDGGLFLDS
mmetsp:Transcript_55249/g.108076  ORF Transcript_55249/g.108076 Transcript_55249/m.108076 type:complete len:283 (+) Transcript_55249:3918-4766(+)